MSQPGSGTLVQEPSIDTLLFLLLVIKLLTLLMIYCHNIVPKEQSAIKAIIILLLFASRYAHEKS